MDSEALCFQLEMTVIAACKGCCCFCSLTGKAAYLRKSIICREEAWSLFGDKISVVLISPQVPMPARVVLAPGDGPRTELAGEHITSPRLMYDLGNAAYQRAELTRVSILQRQYNIESMINVP